MNYEQAKAKILSEDIQVTKHSWDLCKVLRKATEADVEFINFPPEGLIVEDCENRICDCHVAIFQPTEEDLKADDFVIAV